MQTATCYMKTVFCSNHFFISLYYFTFHKYLKLRKMKTVYLFLLTSLIFFTENITAQTNNKSELTVKQIMQGDDFVGHLPGQPFWSINSDKIYFKYNPNKAISDSLYSYDLKTKKTEKVSFEEKITFPEDYVFNSDSSFCTYSKHGDIFIYNIEKSSVLQITKTAAFEYNPKFLLSGNIVYQADNNLFVWNVLTGQTKQVTDFKDGTKPVESKLNEQNTWLKEDQLKLFDVLKTKNEKEKARKLNNEKLNKLKPFPVFLQNKRLITADLSPDEKYVSYLTVKYSKNKNTIVPNYVTTSGYTEDINSRSKVGRQNPKYYFSIYDIKARKTFLIDFTGLEGYDYVPEFTKDYPNKKYENNDRVGYIQGPFWSSNGKNAFIEILSNDHKDRWLALVNFENKTVKTIEHQHNKAWIGGPGISWFSDYKKTLGWLPDNETIYFQSEESGWSHLYTYNIKTGKKKQITKGKYEIYNPQLSKNGKYWYFSSNEVHPGEVQFYRCNLNGKNKIRITKKEGNNEVVLSPDEKYMIIRYSYCNKPWELFLMKNEREPDFVQITHSLTPEFKKYPWRAPEIITFKASDNAKVYARIYEPKENVKNNAAVIFVHGAGYLQNADKKWSYYFREYMFHNILADNGYTVLDIDYRGSAGYGRDWRTAIYRYMSGKDLSDQVDGAEFLVKNYGINPEKIGIYGGSYGGFITLAAMFKTPETFKAGAAIRSVADWAHYNHGYTSNILNTPVTDSLAYVRSSPIYYADGLKGHLLMLHGMIDDNVHYQDVVRLSQKLIELGKHNWEIAPYPVERHGFKQASSWTDEYIRIFNLFQKELNNKD